MGAKIAKLKAAALFALLLSIGIGEAAAQQPADLKGRESIPSPRPTPAPERGAPTPAPPLDRATAPSTKPSLGEAAPAQSRADFDTLLQSQDVYVRMSPTGEPLGFYSVPSGERVPEGAAPKAPGEKLVKVDGSWWKWAVPSQEEIAAQFQTLADRARTAVCGMSMRPTEFETSVQLSAAGFVTATLRARWETKTLCTP